MQLLKKEKKIHFLNTETPSGNKNIRPPEWQHFKECTCRLLNIAMRDYQTDEQTHGQTNRHQTIRIYHDFIQGQGNPPEYQRFAVHDEA